MKGADDGLCSGTYGASRSWNELLDTVCAIVFRRSVDSAVSTRSFCAAGCTYNHAMSASPQGARGTLALYSATHK